MPKGFSPAPFHGCPDPQVGHAMSKIQDYILLLIAFIDLLTAVLQLLCEGMAAWRNWKGPR